MIWKLIEKLEFLDKRQKHFEKPVRLRKLHTKQLWTSQIDLGLTSTQKVYTYIISKTHNISQAKY